MTQIHLAFNKNTKYWMMCHSRWWELCRTSRRIKTKHTVNRQGTPRHNTVCYFACKSFTHTHRRTYVRTSNKCIKKVAIGHSMTDRPHGHHFLYFLLLLLLFKLHRYNEKEKRCIGETRKGKSNEGEILWQRQ